MLLRVALWISLITLSCCAGHEKEELTTDDYPTATLGYEYDDTFDYSKFPAGHEKEELTTHDYPTATLDYEYYYTIDYSEFPEEEPYIWNKASGTGQLNLVFLLGLVLHQIWT